MVKCSDYVLIKAIAQCDQLLQISFAHTGHGTTIIGKEYVCVLRLHSAIESETQLAKVTLNVLTTNHYATPHSPLFPFLYPIDIGSDGWCIVSAPSSHISCQEAAAS